ncbi:MAG: hypothetical protein QOF01_3930 [Thermomicrobiales bacterium]|jgi:DNA-binding CsgD family transcriptional regulator|nr:hypothetical protein [Thermomicrobiales bacterium]
MAALLGRIDRGAGDPLPTAVRSAVAALRVGSEGAVVGTVAVSVPGGAVRVEASPAGADGAVAVVLSAERPPAPPSVPGDWPLSPQERQVVELLIRGLGNREIADRLFVSEHTVEWHLGHAYEKVGVRSRSQLLARLFHELYLPNVAALGDAGAAVDEPTALPPRRGRVA